MAHVTEWVLYKYYAEAGLTPRDGLEVGETMQKKQQSAVTWSER